MAACVYATKKDVLTSFDSIKNDVENELGYPVFIKPANSGSSVGVSKVNNGEELKEALLKAIKFDSKILIDSGCYFATSDYMIGLVSAMSDLGLDTAGITCEATGDAPEKVVITVTDNTVAVEFVSE